MQRLRHEWHIIPNIERREAAESPLDNGRSSNLVDV